MSDLLPSGPRAIEKCKSETQKETAETYEFDCSVGWSGLAVRVFINLKIMQIQGSWERLEGRWYGLKRLFSNGPLSE